MKKLLLIYWTGTYNTRYITNVLKSRFENEYEITAFEVNISSPKNIDTYQYDLIGIGYPIYGFNMPRKIWQYIRHQKWNPNAQYFIYKNSGETLHANDASSYYLFHYLKRRHCKVTNEYHFLMPYNIHFRFDDDLVNEILHMDDKLADILHYEVTNHIPNIKKYKIIDKFVTFNVGIIHIGGDINSFFYRVDKDKCIHCMKCVNVCPMKNIYQDRKGRIRLHHHCEMCMRCSFLCPKDAFHIGYLKGWKVNGAYDLAKIKQMKVDHPVITEKTTGFFACYKETYDYINNRHKEIFK